MVSGGHEPWPLINEEQVDNWIQRCGPSSDRIREVVDLIVEVLEKAPNIGLRSAVLLGLPRYHALTDSGRDSVTWTLLDIYGDRPRGIWINQIEPAISVSN